MGSKGILPGVPTSQQSSFDAVKQSASSLHSITDQSLNAHRSKMENNSGKGSSSESSSQKGINPYKSP
jgi:hypothetical protein